MNSDGGCFGGCDLAPQLLALAGRDAPGALVQGGLGLLAFLDDLAQAHLVCLGEQGEATGLVQVQAEEVRAGAQGVPGGAALRWCWCGDDWCAHYSEREPQSRPLYAVSLGQPL